MGINEKKDKTARRQAERQREEKKRRGRKPRSVCVAEPGLCTSLLVRKHTGMCSFSLKQADEHPGLRTVGVQEADESNAATCCVFLTSKHDPTRFDLQERCCEL